MWGMVHRGGGGHLKGGMGSAISILMPLPGATLHLLKAHVLLLLTTAYRYKRSHCQVRLHVLKPTAM